MFVDAIEYEEANYTLFATIEPSVYPSDCKTSIHLHLQTWYLAILSRILSMKVKYIKYFKL